jgi:hypothetical protein
MFNHIVYTNYWTLPLSNAGSISHKAAELHATQEFQKYDDLRLQNETENQNDFDRIASAIKQLGPSPKARRQKMKES